MQAVTSLQVGKVFTDDDNTPLNTIHFSDSGQHIVACAKHALYVYNCCEGRRGVKVNLNLEFDAGIARWTHTQGYVLHSHFRSAQGGEGEFDVMRYTCLGGGQAQYVRYFFAHKAKITSMAMSPSDDSFISASEDGVVRTWDLRVNAPQGKLDFSGGKTYVAADPRGTVFGVASSGQSREEVPNAVRLYDIRKYTAGAFSTFWLGSKIGPLTQPSTEIGSIKFDALGHYLLITSTENAMLVLDGATGEVVHSIVDEVVTKSGTQCVPDFNADGSVIAMGSEDGAVHFWSSDTGKRITSHVGHADAVNCVAFNHAYMLMASCCAQLALWIVPNEGRASADDVDAEMADVPAVTIS
eukprot:NODE_1697_length_1246_cov_29.789991_g1682_i0.p1 GENE.NODE_1697_length_1246_cov_29.789991_g1682_i0~~NODE_1697_length_1246_cov_29.789991_g1682_i0.p1  ORF type:complete len:354 (+),score=35.38 NODE_1697_length_1246_cov_29.789991_g1682_i0:87-1148(+)